MVTSFSALGKYGKLGNALFQISCTVALALRNNDIYRFPNTWKYRDAFAIPPDSFTNSIRAAHTYQEPAFHYVPIVYKPNMDLHGYFQSEKYFADYSNVIRQMLALQTSYTYPDKASIHVRRTDYLQFPNHHPQLGMGYYEKAMELSGFKSFIVVSDDLPWCKEHFTGNAYDFAAGSDIDDLALQTVCGCNIIANSSFSWWGAWLNTSSSKIAPSQWFGPALSSHNTKDLIPAHWRKI